MAFTGPGIACDWLDIEGPLHDVWPPRRPPACCSATCRSRSSSRRSIPASARRSASRSAADRRRARTGPTRSRASGPSHSERAAGRRRPPARGVPAAGVPPAGRRTKCAQAVRRAGRGAAEGRRLLRDGDALGVPRGALLAGFPLPRRAGRASSTTTPSPAGCRTSSGTRCPTSALTQLADAGKLRDARRAARRGRAAAEGPEVAAVRRGLPRPVAEAAADRRQRPRPQALPRVQPVPAGLDGRRDAGLLPRAARQGPRRRATS